MESKQSDIIFDRINMEKMADHYLSILDEDGQPMYNPEWIKKNILGIDEEEEVI